MFRLSNRSGWSTEVLLGKDWVCLSTLSRTEILDEYLQVVGELLTQSRIKTSRSGYVPLPRNETRRDVHRDPFHLFPSVTNGEGTSEMTTTETKTSTKMVVTERGRV